MLPCAQKNVRSCNSAPRVAVLKKISEPMRGRIHLRTVRNTINQAKQRASLTFHKQKQASKDELGFGLHTRTERQPDGRVSSTLCGCQWGQVLQCQHENANRCQRQWRSDSVSAGHLYGHRTRPPRLGHRGGCTHDENAGTP